jgi:anti-sigma-K factor RskA
MNHEEAQMNLPAYALGALEAGEASSVREHVRGCAICRAELADYALVRAGLDEAVDDTPLPVGFTQRLASRAVALDRPASAQALPTSAPEAGPSPSPATRPRRMSWLPWALTAACLALALGLGAWGLRLQGELGRTRGEVASLRGEVAQLRESDARVARLLAQPSVLSRRLQAGTPGVDGRMYMPPERGEALLVIGDLPQLPRGKVYQLWLLAPGGAVESAGTFTPIGDGAARLYLNPASGLGRYNGLGVTVEPAGGSPGPTSDPLVRADL